MTGFELGSSGVRMCINNCTEFVNLFEKFFEVAVVVAQLAEQSLPIPKDPGSNPVIGNFY